MATDQIWKTRRLTQELDSDMNSSGLVDQGPGILGYLRSAVILRTQKPIHPPLALLQDVLGLLFSPRHLSSTDPCGVTQIHTVSSVSDTDHIQQLPDPKSHTSFLTVDMTYKRLREVVVAFAAHHGQP